MQPLPRLAVGGVHPQADGRPITWALLGALSAYGQVQHFRSQAQLCLVDGARSATGLATRQLDSWLMSAEHCRWLFHRAMHSADLAIISGHFQAALPAPPQPGGRLDVLCQWLDLPRVAVLDARSLGSCQLPARPSHVQGLLIDRVAGAEEFVRLQVTLESLWGIPVLGGLESLPRVRDQLAALPCDSVVPEELNVELLRSFLRFGRLEALLDLAASRPLPASPPCSLRPPARSAGLTVAVAYDDVFGGYFADTLELLEAHGATVVDFSPLRDEEPPEADVIYFGCGHPELFAEQLAENHCMSLALRRRLCAGTRMFAEGGGMAYLCQQLQMPCGQLYPMVGVLPAVARMAAQPMPLEPMELTLSRGTWIGGAGTRLRGYRNPNWQLEPAGALIGCAGEGGQRRDVVGRYLAVATNLQLHFAAQPHLMQRFFKPHAAAAQQLAEATA